MKLVKMSLVAAIAVAGLSTASLADEMMKKDMMMGGTKVSGSTDFRWKSTTTGDVSENGSNRERVRLEFKSASEDGKGKVHVRLQTEASAIGVDKAYATYKLGSVDVGVGPKIGFPGNFSYSTIRGITVSTKVAGFTIGAGVADMDTGKEGSYIDSENKVKPGEKSIITAKGKVAIADLRFDYRLGANKMDYLATDVKVKAGPATIIGAYALGMGDNNEDRSIMGADVSVGLGSITAYGAFSITGDKGGKVSEAGTAQDANNAMGNIKNALGDKVTAMKFGVKAKVAGIAVQGSYSMATPDGGDTSNKIFVDAKKSLNTQSSVNVRYSIDSTGKTGDDDSTNVIELRFASKF